MKINNNLSSNNKENFNIYFSNYSKNKKLKNENENDLQNIRKKLYKPKKEIKSKLYDQIKKNEKNNYSPEKYAFLPKINKKSKEICEKKYNLNKTPINDLLYEDANNKKEKLNKMYLTENDNIIANSNTKKINVNSNKIAGRRLNKKIENVIKKYALAGKLSIVKFTQCLHELNIITELIKKINNKDKNDNLKLSDLQSIISSLNEKDINKLKEIEILEQLWFIINPFQTQYINSNILSELLKILLSTNDNNKDAINNIEKILEKYNINNNEENENDEIYNSPLRDKQYNKKELWSIKKLIKIFSNLKKNLSAYKDNDNQKEDKIIKKRDEDLTFKPNLISNSYFYKHSKYNYNKENEKYESSNDNIKKKKNDFDKIYKRFMAEKELHEKTLERIREIKREKESEKCTYIPKINKYIPKSRDKNIRKNRKIIDSEDSNMLQKNKSTSDIKTPRYKKLYNLRKDFYENNNKVLD